MPHKSPFWQVNVVGRQRTGGGMKFAAVAGHRCGRATPSLHDAPQRQSMERIGRESIYRDRNAVQTNPATSVLPPPYG
jgi:hypothetical protein